MSVFLALMAAGLTGLVVMALPAFGHHAHFGALRGPGVVSHGGGLPLKLGAGTTHADAGGQTLARGASNGPSTAPMLRFLPSPRMIFSVLALYGAFGNLFRAGLHLPMLTAALLAVVPAVLLERFAVTPLWNAMLAAQGTPCSPLEALTLCEAEAVTPFRNGKGIVVMERDGRAVQFSAQLLPEQAHLPVRVGDRLRVEEVDPARERMTVTLLH